MNWLRSILSIIGSFWLRLFKSTSVARCMASLCAACGNAAEKSADDALASRINTDRGCSVKTSYYPVYIPVSSVSARATLGETFAALFGSSAANEWSVSFLRSVAVPDVLYDSPLIPGSAFIRGYDYRSDGKTAVFKANPAAAGLKVMPVLTDSGALVDCYVLYGRHYPGRSAKDAVYGFFGRGYNDVSDILWHMRTVGPSLLDIKRLLAYAAGSTVCERGGVIMGMWSESGFNCIDVGGKLYSSTLSPVGGLRPGISVSSGDVLFGDIRFYDGKSQIPADSAGGIDYLEAMTDAGMVKFANAVVPSIPVTDAGGSVLGYTLNVRGLNAGLYVAYERRCAELRKGGLCSVPAADVQASENPAMYIAGKLRRGKGLIASMHTCDEARLSKVMAAIRRCSGGAGIVTIYRRTAA